MERMEEQQASWLIYGSPQIESQGDSLITDTFPSALSHSAKAPLLLSQALV
jgi:hypothetical protein